MSSWKITKLEDHLYPVTKQLGIDSFSWKAEMGLLKWTLYEYKTNTFHLFTTRKERRALELKLRGTNKMSKDVMILGRFKKPLLKMVDSDFFEYVGKRSSMKNLYFRILGMTTRKPFQM
tara:strand:- start:2366 stop:2722 length:357 start_codon:yes stop_codon:yes gene_type:complete